MPGSRSHGRTRLRLLALALLACLAVGLAGVLAATLGGVEPVVAAVCAAAVSLGALAAIALERAPSVLDDAAFGRAARNERPDRALTASARLAAAGATAVEREDVLALLVDEARNLVDAATVLVLPGDAGSRTETTALVHELGVVPERLIAVPFERSPASMIVATGVEVEPARARIALEGLAAIGRSALTGVEARSEVHAARRVEEVIGAVARKLTALGDPSGVASALAAELRNRLPIESVGIRLGDDAERWYPASAEPDDEGPNAAELLVFDGVALGALRHVPQRALGDDEQMLLARLIELGALALGVASLRANARRLAGAQSSVSRAAEALAAETEAAGVLARLVELAPSAVSADAAAVWIEQTGTDELALIASHGHPAALSEATLRIDDSCVGSAISTGRPVVRRFDPAADEPVHAAFASVRRELAVPLRIDRDGRAALVISAYTPHPAFTTTDIEQSTALARLATRAIDTAMVIGARSVEARLERASSLIAGELATARSLTDARGALARAAKQIFGADRVTVRLGQPGESAPTTLERICMEERRVIVAAALADDSRVRRSELRDLKGASLLAIPLASVGARTAAGQLTLIWDAPRTFDDADVALADRLRDAASTAIERAALEEAERRASTTARELQRIGALLAADLDTRVVLRQIASQAVALLEADACALRLREGDDLVLRAFEGEDEFVPAVPIADPVAAEVLAATRPVTVADRGTERRSGRAATLAQAGFRAYAAAPIGSSDGGVVGALVVYSKTPRSWLASDADALEAFANSASVTLRNAFLYEQVASEKDNAAAILGQVADALVATSSEGRVTLWNTTAEHVTELAAERALGRELGELLRSEFGDADGSALAVLGAAGPDVPSEVRLTRAGQDLWLSVTAAPLRASGDDALGRVFAMRDVSDERALDQLKSDFVATVSHELRTPLTSIYGFAETLLREDASFAEAERTTFMRYIASEAERLTRLVEGLLSVTRLEAGAVELALRPVDIAAEVRELVAWASGRSEKHTVELVLPPGSAYATADADRTRQVLINLIDNAIKYSPDGGTVTVRVRKRRRVIELSVADQGIGISERDQRNLFRKFFRVDAAMSRGIRGIGLGLYLVRGFVTAMGGRIWVESTEDAGSTFFVELPASEQLAEEAAPRRRRGAA